MANYTIKYNSGACIGAGSCVAACPENYSLGSDNKAIVKTKTITDKELKKNIAAAKSCPTLAIEIYDAKGKKVAP
ncbi:ferredoxin [Candidatus Woesearchaeota archaeon]|nr:ferredoxin [Candidatus Woesearchaeota archaeon]MDP1694608.1 ferredoxin [Candidatus Woesearchaeota archaeon]